MWSRRCCAWRRRTPRRRSRQQRDEHDDPGTAAQDTEQRDVLARRRFDSVRRRVLLRSQEIQATGGLRIGPRGTVHDADVAFQLFWLPLRRCLRTTCRTGTGWRRSVTCASCEQGARPARGDRTGAPRGRTTPECASVSPNGGRPRFMWELGRLYRRLARADRFDVAHQLNPVDVASLALTGDRRRWCSAPTTPTGRRRGRAPTHRSAR